jgi:dTDP-4-dehydrorhamnose reductase
MNARRKLLLTGPSGLLGSAIIDGWNPRWDITALIGRHRIKRGVVANVPGDLLAPMTLGPIVEASRPDVIVHAGAWTDLDGCEADPARARTIHRDATAALAEAAAAVKAAFVYISTDALFSGADAPHAEDEPVDPQSVYARTKREGEEAALAAGPALVIRTSIVGWNAQPKVSLAEWFLRELRAGRPVNGFTDVWFTPISTTRLATAIERLVDQQARGILHVSGGEAVSKHEFGVTLAEVFGLPKDLVRPSSIAAAKMRAPRPVNPSLDSSRYAALTGDRPPTVRETLEELRRLELTGWPDHLRTGLA